MNNLSMAYGNKLLFTDVTLKLNSGLRYALVGANGTGKSTLLRLITGEEEPSLGGISFPKETKVGWLKQDQYRYEKSDIIDVVIRGKPVLWQALEAKANLLGDECWDEAKAHRLSELEEVIAHEGGYTAEALAEKLLVGLGVALEYHRQPLSCLSGGFKLRVLLAQTLFQQPDLLLLDEPTNHLDIVSIRWLESYLKSEFPGLLIFISHDLSFIDALADKILDVDYGEIREYSGRWATYMEEKQLLEAQKLQEKKNVEQKRDQMQRFVERFRAKASKAKQAQSRVKQIERLEIPDIKRSSRLAPHFRFKPCRPSGKEVLSVEGLSKRYEDRPIFEQVSFQVLRGEKIAILGANGVGKSTLIKTLLSRVRPDSGKVEWGYETHISYFSQDHHEDIHSHMTALQWLHKEVSDVTEQQARAMLGQMLFRQDEVKHDVLKLSGGEAARLLLARMMLQKANVLVLDEPTNHLDIDTIEALADSLAHYSGTVIIVSHNVHFVQKIAKRVLFISHEHGLVDFQRGYEEYEASAIACPVLLSSTKNR